MNDIDWSKAPEWSGAVVESASGNLFWVEEFGVKSRRQSFDSSEPDEHYIADMTLPDHGWRLVEARPKAWTGEGLPPVGTELECGFACEGFKTWHKGVCVAIGIDPEDRDEICVVKSGDKISMYTTYGGRMRPIRTPEHIAAEEREKAINEMVAQSPMLVKTWSRKVCQALYDAGYRKQEQTK